jgi:hypothetical protein
MSEFSVTHIATEGFRVTRENPVAVAIWSVLEIILQFAMAVAMVKSGFALQLEALTQGAAPDFTGLAEAFGPLQAQMLWFLPLCLVIQILFRAAILRAILRPAERSLGYVRFGGDELRLLGLQILLGLAFTVAFTVMTVVAALLGRAGGAGALAATVVIVGGVCGIIFVLVRLSLAAPQTFATRRLNILGSWTLTQGRFWPLLGAYLLAFVFYIAVLILGSIVGGVLSLAGGGDMGGAASLSTYFTATNVISIVVQGTIAALGTVLLLAAPAAAYKTLTGGPDLDVF